MDGGWVLLRPHGARCAFVVSGDVTVRVNSNGGDPFEGEAARAAFEAHSGKVTVLVTGMAASAASLLIMGADQIELSAGSFIMIHDPSGGVGGPLRHMRLRRNAFALSPAPMPMFTRSAPAFRVKRSRR